MNKVVLLLSLLFWAEMSTGQKTYAYFQNNTNLSLQFTTAVTGGLSASNYVANSGAILPMKAEVELFNVKRTFGFSSTRKYYELISTLTPTGSTPIQCKVQISELLGSTTLKQAASGTGFSDSYIGDRTLYVHDFSLNGIMYCFRYAAYSTVPSGTYDDVLFSLDYVTPPPAYTVNPADLTNNNVLNVLAYNVFMRPTSLFPNDDQALRGKYIHRYVKNMDVIILEEVFDNNVRPPFLDSLKMEYPYQTTVVDNPSSALEDGGTLIISRFPIETEGQYLWENNCNSEDCTANKGIKYARINKLGKKYHIFGTHMDAMNTAPDVAMRKIQLELFRDYITSLNIPATEAVVMGGDFNVDKLTNKAGEYDSLFTPLFNAQLPTYIGHPTSWDKEYNYYLTRQSDVPEHLDYVVANTEYLTPQCNTNTVLMLRDNSNEMWRTFDLSDHFALWGRMVFQAPTTITALTSSCEGNATATASPADAYLWNTGATTATIANLSSGNYTVTITNTTGCSATSSVTIANTNYGISYATNFDNDKNEWKAEGTNSSWEWNTSTKPIASRLNKVWITRANTNGYNNNELSYLYSPCFNTAAASSPILTFKRSFRLAANDKAWIEYNINNTQWIKLGSTTSGKGWYNNDANVWAGISGYTQTQIPLPQATSIRFRIVFETNSTYSEQGFVLDYFNVSNSATALSILDNTNTINNNLNQITIYPNPSTGNIHIQLEGTKSDNGTLQLFNSTGSLIADLTNSLDKTTNLQTISFENMNATSGMYFIIWKNETKVLTQKYIIHK